VSDVIPSTTYVSMPVRDAGEPYAESRAALMLKDGLAALKQNRHRSGRDVARALGYKQSVVLSHMASGRVPIPLERAEAIAREVEISAGEFFLAAVEQRCSSASRLLADCEKSNVGSAFGFVTELEELAGVKIESLSAEHKDVLREVVADPRPARRWLSVQELSIMGRLRSAWSHLRDVEARENLWSAIHRIIDSLH
jgi:DNA-binding transcriptional regulator YdaS (Cro superfamily)